MSKPDRRPERIPAIMGELQALWEKFPDLRLGQLLSNAALSTDVEDMVDLFYIEDKDLLEKMRRYYRSIKGK